MPRNAANQVQPPTTLIRDAHKAGLVVHAWTFRNENNFLSADHRQGNPASPLYLAAMGNAAAEYELFYELGLDGLFSDNTDTAVAARERIYGSTNDD